MTRGVCAICGELIEKDPPTLWVHAPEAVRSYRCPHCTWRGTIPDGNRCLHCGAYGLLDDHWAELAGTWPA